MNKFSTITIVLTLIGSNAFSSDLTSKNPSSAESLFSSSCDINDATGAVNRIVLENLIGFPFDSNTVDEKTQRLINGTFSSYLHVIEDNIIDLYWSGSLTQEKRAESLNKIIQNNHKKMNHLPLEGIMNLSALSTQEPEIDITKLFASFMVCGAKGLITDIIPFLEYSRVFVGDEFLALGFRGAVVSWSQVEQEPEKPLPPELRLAFWPVANAILKNPDVSLPLMIDAVKDKNLRIDLRLRAASFINTLDPDIINDELLLSCEKEIQEKLLCIKNDGIKWRHSLAYVQDGNFMFRKNRNEILRKRLHLPENVDMKQIREQMDKSQWGEY
jgi:hypothetical protein